MGPTGLGGYEGREKREKQDEKLIVGRLRRLYTFGGRGSPPLQDSLPRKVDYGKRLCLLAVLWECSTTHYYYSLPCFFLFYCHCSSREMELDV